jgi:hypothetical protein
MNGTEEKWKKLSDVIDVAALSTKMNAEDWNICERLAANLKQTTRLLTGLHIAHLLFEIHIPEKLQRHIRKQQKTEKLAISAIQRLADGLSTRPDGIPERIYSIRCMDSTKQKTRALFRYAFSPGFEEYGAADLPDRFAVLYSLIRFYRVAIAALTNIFVCR